MTELERLEYHDVIKCRHRLAVQKLQENLEVDREYCGEDNYSMLTYTLGAMLAVFMAWMFMVLHG